MGGKSTSTSSPKLNGIAVQSSVLGIPLAVGWGRTRIKANLLWYNAFTAIPHVTKQSGGKGIGGGKSTNTTYTYTASLIMGLCEGPIQGVRSIYRDKSVFTNGATTALAQAGLNLALGTPGQSTWGYLTSIHPTQALGYSGIAYTYAQDYDLNDTATLPNHTFEVDFAIQMAGLADADPRDIIVDVLTNANYGVSGWGAGLIGDLSDYSLYCRSNNLLLSPALESQVSASEFITEVMAATNCEPVWSEGVLKVRTYGDAPATGNGVTWTPDLTPAYDLTEDDFVGGVSLEIRDQSDAYNVVQVEFLDRANQYNVAIATADDLANVVQFGERKADPETWRGICDAAIAKKSAELLLNRTLYRRDLYRFTLPWDYALLEPMDYVTLTTISDGLSLTRQLVQMVSIEENEDGELSCEAEGVMAATTSPALYPSHSASGYSPNLDVAPGNVSTPIIFNAPTSLTGGDPQVWCAVSSTSANWGGANVFISFDNIAYTNIGRIDGPARYGVTTNTLATGTDPDTVNTVGVTLATSRGTLGAATAAEVAAEASLCYLDGELIAYRDATLTGANAYTLGYLRRGLRGTPIAAHASGSQFARLDDAIFKFSYPDTNIGDTIYIKFQSFNVFGRAAQDISTLSPYTVNTSPAVALPEPVTGLALAGTGGTTWSGSQINVMCNASARATSYRFDFYKFDGTTLLRQITSALPSALYTADLALLDGPQRTYVIRAVASNAAGTTSPSTTITITNAAPAAITGVTGTGGATTGTVSWSATADADALGYTMYFHTAASFNPKSAGKLIATYGLSQTIYGLAAGTYYAKVAARDGWTGDPDVLNFSTEVSFVVTTGGGGGAPSGGGGGGGGYSDRNLF